MMPYCPVYWNIVNSDGRDIYITYFENSIPVILSLASIFTATKLGSFGVVVGDNRYLVFTIFLLN